MAVALLVFGVYDLRLGLSLRTVFQLPDAIETLTAAFGLRYAFGATMGVGFDVAVDQDPCITFHSTKIQQTGPDTFSIEGRFTIRGVSKPETLNLTLSGKGTGHGYIAGTMAFDRKEFGMNSGIPFIKIADRVEVTVDLTADRISGPPVVLKE